MKKPQEMNTIASAIATTAALPNGARTVPVTIAAASRPASNSSSSAMAMPLAVVVGFSNVPSLRYWLMAGSRGSVPLLLK
jgi:hypothetical protein